MEPSANISQEATQSWREWETIFPEIANLVLTLDVICSINGVLGCFGNLFTIIIISKWDNMSSGAAFMLSLAITDLITVFIDAILHTALPLLGVLVSAINDIVCATYTFLSWITTITSYYITVLFTFDKCVAVTFPFKYRTQGKPKIALIATILAYVALSAYCVPAIFVFRIHPATKTCRPYDFSIISREFFFETRTQIGNFLSGIIPVALVFIFTTITILKLKRQGNKHIANGRGNLNSQRDREITRQMIVVGISFAVFCSGFTICIFIKQRIVVQTAFDEAMRVLLESIQYNFMALANSSNFYIYMVFGKKFRACFCNLLRKENAEARSAVNDNNSHKNSNNNNNVDNRRVTTGPN